MLNLFFFFKLANALNTLIHLHALKDVTGIGNADFILKVNCRHAVSICTSMHLELRQTGMNVALDKSLQNGYRFDFQQISFACISRLMQILKFLKTCCDFDLKNNCRF
jgi:hypothetical protein